MMDKDASGQLRFFYCIIGINGNFRVLKACLNVLTMLFFAHTFPLVQMSKTKLGCFTLKKNTTFKSNDKF